MRTDLITKPLAQSIEARVQRFRWGPQLSQRPRDPEVQAVYRRMLGRLQRDMLLWVTVVGVVLSVALGIQLFYNCFVARTMPPLMFTTHVARVALVVALVGFFLVRRQVAAGWTSMLLVGLSGLLFQIWLLREPSLLGFALFSLAGPAMVMPARVSGLLAGALALALYLIVRLTFPVYSDAWVSVTLSFTALMSAFIFIGTLIRRFIRQFAHTTVEMERSAAQHARVEQQMEDLHQRVAQLTALEHDLRQPLRAVQGYLMTLRAEVSEVDDLIQPAIAAQRADRLMNNLLDLTRAETQQPQHGRKADMNRFFEAIAQAAPGIACYYTNPPVPIRFALQPLPTAVIHQEQLERAAQSARQCAGLLAARWGDHCARLGRR